jgi:hypothetical protein
MWIVFKKLFKNQPEDIWQCRLWRPPFGLWLLFSHAIGEVLLSARKRRAHQVKQHALGSAPGLVEGKRTPAVRRSAGGEREGKQKSHLFSPTNGEVLLSARKRRANQVKQHALGSAPGLLRSAHLLWDEAQEVQVRKESRTWKVTFFLSPSWPKGSKKSWLPGFLQDFSEDPQDQDTSAKTAAHASSTTRNL